MIIPLLMSQTTKTDSAWQRPTLDEIIEHHKEKGLVAHEDLVRVMAKRVEGIPVKIPFEEIQKYASLLAVWPLIEEYKLSKKSINGDLNQDERNKLTQLKSKYEKLSVSSDIASLMSNL